MLKPTVGIELLREMQVRPGDLEELISTYSMVNSPPWQLSHQYFAAYIVLGSYRKDSQERCLASILQTNHSYIHLSRPIETKSSAVPWTQGRLARQPARILVGWLKFYDRSAVKWIWTVDPTRYY